MVTKIFIRFFVLFSLFFIIGCKSLQSNTEVQKLKFAYIAKQRGQSFHEEVIKGIMNQMAKKHVVVDIFAARDQDDIETQKDLIRRFIKSREYSGIIISPNDSSSLVDDIRKLDEAGIPFTFIDTPLVENDVTKSFRNDCGIVATDNRDVGKIAFSYIHSFISKGNIVLIRGIHEHRSSMDREEGFVKEVTQNPNFKIKGYVPGGWKTDITHREYSDWLGHNKIPIDAVFAYNDHMALGVSRYYDEHTQLKKPIIVGVDGTVIGQRGLLEKKIDAIVVQAPELMGVEGLNRMIACVTENTKVSIMTPLTLLTATMALK